MCYGYDGEGALRTSLEKRGMSRRSMFKGTLGAIAGAGALSAGSGLVSPAAAAPRTGVRPVPPGRISIQLYSLRSIMNGDGVDQTFAALGEMGYPRVELAGYYGRTAEQMRALADSVGVRAMSSHDGISGSPEALETKLDNAETMGQRFMVVPYLNSSSMSDWQMWAEQMNEEGAAAKARGLAYGYHNHAHEFTTDLGGGVTPWEVLTSELDPKYVHLEIDIYWIVTGGVNTGLSDEDAVQFAIDGIAAAPQKVRQYHVKDRISATGDHADLGTGFIDFAKVFRSHTVEDYIVENDTPEITPLHTAQVGYDYLRNVRF